MSNQNSSGSKCKESNCNESSLISILSPSDSRRSVSEGNDPTEIKSYEEVDEDDMFSESGEPTEYGSDPEAAKMSGR